MAKNLPRHRDEFLYVGWLRASIHSFIQLLWVLKSCGLGVSVAHIDPLVLALVNISNSIVLASPSISIQTCKRKKDSHTNFFTLAITTGHF